MKVETSFEKRHGLPSPLAFHLGATLINMQQEMLAAHAADPVAAFKSNLEKMREILDALKTWQQHPFHRQNSDPPVVWQSGSSRLLDYGGASKTIPAPPVLVIPSLVNKPYILDLSPENSLMQMLAATGLRPYLLDWGTPEMAESEFDLNDYIQLRAMPALNEIHQISGVKTGVLGYCMGGTIAASMSLLSNKINALATIGAPWDFSNPTGNRLLLQQIANADNGQNLRTLIQNLSQAFGNLPFVFLQSLFAAINPNQFQSKFLRFNQMDPLSNTAQQFVAIEDWLNDGLPLTGPAADGLLVKWHIQNQIMNGKWRINDTRIDAKKITIPGMFACGKSDTIAPPEATLALPEQVRNAALIQPDTGHVGMIVGSKSREQVILPIANFLLKHADMPPIN
ncbi:MAG: alpha/beta fold hydrolase [Rhodobacteraceae bacterium]|nr:alpha/beta fold hydrolase [Paracoccaceae bacterium]